MTGTEIIFVVEESPEGGYEARALGHSIYTQADDLYRPDLRFRALQSDQALEGMLAPGDR